MEPKNLSLGRRVFSGLVINSKDGLLLISLEMWAFLNPWFLRRDRTVSGLSEDSNFSFSGTEMGTSGDNPQVFMR